jgi:type IV pilus assembly protein PilC
VPNIRLSNPDKLNLISNLSTMLGAGIPILETVESMIPELKGSQKKILEVLQEDIGQGKKISQSFAQFPNAFDPVTINLIAAAEQAGTLDTTLKDLTINIKKEIEFTDTIKSAMTYPVLVMVVFVAILLIIITFVIPRISKVFLSLRVPLPLPTKILIYSSQIFLKYMPLVGLGVAAIVALVIFLFRTYKKAFTNFFLSLPMFSQLALEIDITRYTRSLALLLNSGIPIIDAMELAEHVVAKKSVADVFTKSRDMVSKGKNLSEGLKENQKIIPGMMIRITQAGEKTGTLAKSMQDLSEFFDTRVSKKVKNLTTLLEPLMLAFIGVMVGGMMLAIIAPIYGIIGQINTR